MSKKKLPIFSYWEGKKPAYIEMCQESLFRHCGDDFEIIIMDEGYPGPKGGKRNLSINHKTDWIKVDRVFRRGGFWIDADMIVMQNLLPLVEFFKSYSFIGIPGFFGAPKYSRTLKTWRARMKKRMAEKKKLGFSDLIQPLLKNRSFKEFEPLTKEMICPIYHTGDEFWNFFESRNLDDFVKPNTFVVTLYNSAFSEQFNNMTRQEILSQNWLISKMFKKALGL